MANKYKKITDYFSEETVGLISREKELKQLMYAILTKEHMLLTGPAGTGKSQFAMQAFQNINGAKTFAIHLTKQTTEEYVFGPLDITEFKKGKIKHNIEEGILKADFAFIDEFFDASDVLLRSLLGVLNERVWMKAGHIKAPLHTAVLTSNYIRGNEVTEAVLDRIIFKAKIGELKTQSERVKAYTSYLESNKKKIDAIELKELQELSEKVEDPKSVKLSADLLKTFDKIKEEYVKEISAGGIGVGENGKYISQRTLHKALKVVKAEAILNNRKEADYEDLEALKYVFCTLNVQEEEQFFDAVFEKIVGPIIRLKKIEEDMKSYSKELAKMPTFKEIEKYSAKNQKDIIETCRQLTVFDEGISGLVTQIDTSTSQGKKLKTQVERLQQDGRDLAEVASSKLYEIDIAEEEES